MMGRQDRDQGQLFYEFSLDEMIPTGSHHGAGLVCALLFRSLCLTRDMVAFPVSRSRADDPDAPCRLLLWHSP